MRIQILRRDDLQITFVKAQARDVERVRSLLASNNLPSEDIDAHIEDFILALLDGELAGCSGLEIYGRHALLRSVAVARHLHGKGIGRLLAAKITQYSSDKGVSELYLLTTTAELFFRQMGFSVIDRSAFPAALMNTREAASICPSSAICMKKNI